MRLNSSPLRPAPFFPTQPHTIPSSLTHANPTHCLRELKLANYLLRTVTYYLLLTTYYSLLTTYYLQGAEAIQPEAVLQPGGGGEPCLCPAGKPHQTKPNPKPEHQPTTPHTAPRHTTPRHTTRHTTRHPTAPRAILSLALFLPCSPTSHHPSPTPTQPQPHPLLPHLKPCCRSTPPSPS